MLYGKTNNFAWDIEYFLFFTGKSRFYNQGFVCAKQMFSRLLDMSQIEFRPVWHTDENSENLDLRGSMRCVLETVERRWKRPQMAKLRSHSSMIGQDKLIRDSFQPMEEWVTLSLAPRRHTLFTRGGRIAFEKPGAKSFARPSYSIQLSSASSSSSWFAVSLCGFSRLTAIFCKVRHALSFTPARSLLLIYWGASSLWW